MQETLINRVANSPIITLDLAAYLPSQTFQVLDIKDYLFQEIILKEKDFRQFLKEEDWSKYANTIVLVQCSVDAIIPQWAYALLSTTLSPIAFDVFVGTKQEYIKGIYHNVIANLDVDQYADRPIILKGCGDSNVPAEAYSRMAMKLQNVAKSIMYGEACSAVPIFKQKPVSK